MPGIVFRGYKVDSLTKKMILWAEKKAGFEFTITQGSYNTDVAASAGTHDGGGVIDFSVKGLDAIKKKLMLNALKDAGFAAWHRLVVDGFDTEHIHCVAFGCKNLAPIAERQLKSFDAGRNGLKSNRIDYSYRPNPPVKFSIVWNKPVGRKPLA